VFESLGRYLSRDDLWSALGYALLILLTLGGRGGIDVPAASMLSAGMLAVFWVGSRRVRERNIAPNARVLFWAAIASASALVASA
jgi:hypothetical protein